MAGLDELGARLFVAVSTCPSLSTSSWEPAWLRSAALAKLHASYQAARAAGSSVLERQRLVAALARSIGILLAAPELNGCWDLKVELLSLIEDVTTQEAWELQRSGVRLPSGLPGALPGGQAEESSESESDEEIASWLAHHSTHNYVCKLLGVECGLLRAMVACMDTASAPTTACVHQACLCLNNYLGYMEHDAGVAPALKALMLSALRQHPRSLRHAVGIVQRVAAESGSADAPAGPSQQLEPLEGGAEQEEEKEREREAAEEVVGMLLEMAKLHPAVATHLRATGVQRDMEGWRGRLPDSFEEDMTELLAIFHQLPPHDEAPALPGDIPAPLPSAQQLCKAAEDPAEAGAGAAGEAMASVQEGAAADNGLWEEGRCPHGSQGPSLKCCAMCGVAEGGGGGALVSLVGGAAAAEGIQLKQCGGCGTVSFCSRECQRAHWVLHKPDCKARQRQRQQQQQPGM